MRTRGYVVCAVVMVLLLRPVALAQFELGKGPEQSKASPFEIDAISFASAKPEFSRLDVYVQVGYDKLTFTKRENQYKASYELTIDVLDANGRLVSEKYWTEEITAPSFEQTVSRQAYSLTQRSFEVPPGRYFISAIFRDIETKSPLRVNKQITIPGYSASISSLSDIMLVTRITVSGDKKSIIPNVSPNVGELRDVFHIFFEAYNNTGLDSVKFLASVLNDKKQLVHAVDTHEVLSQGRNQIFMRVPHASLPMGDYSVHVQLVKLRDEEEALPIASTNRRFQVRWGGLPMTVKDLDLAIDQLQYIAKQKELDYIREATTQDERQKRFLEFWRKRDPNPNTPRNEKMEEYYAKIEYANKHFKHYIEGWRTDMGMVYIIFGKPNNVDRHPFEGASKPYEVWSYYELNHQFVFVDESGFGDYRLTTPIWQVWQRLRE